MLNFHIDQRIINLQHQKENYLNLKRTMI